MENEKIDALEKAGTEFINRIADLKPFMAVAIAARDFMHEPENWEGYQDLQTSNSAAIPPEFMALGDAVAAAFGPPANDDEDDLPITKRG